MIYFASDAYKPQFIIVPFTILGPSSLLRNIPMEKLARSYFERIEPKPGATGASAAYSNHTSPISGAGRRSAASRNNSGTGSRTGSRRGSLGAREQLGASSSSNIGRLNAGGLSHSSDFLDYWPTMTFSRYGSCNPGKSKAFCEDVSPLKIRRKTVLEF